MDDEPSTDAVHRPMVEASSMNSPGYENVIEAFCRQESCGNDRRDLSRGYWTDGRWFILNGYQVAVWHEGAVHMYLKEPRWHGRMLAQAISKVQARCTLEHVLILAEDERRCREHADCRTHVSLGEECHRVRFPVLKKVVASDEEKEATG